MRRGVFAFGGNGTRVSKQYAFPRSLSFEISLLTELVVSFIVLSLGLGSVERERVMSPIDGRSRRAKSKLLSYKHPDASPSLSTSY